MQALGKLRVFRNLDRILFDDVRYDDRRAKIKESLCHGASQIAGSAGEDDDFSVQCK